MFLEREIPQDDKFIKNLKASYKQHLEDLPTNHVPRLCVLMPACRSSAPEFIAPNIEILINQAMDCVDSDIIEGMDLVVVGNDSSAKVIDKIDKKLESAILFYSIGNEGQLLDKGGQPVRFCLDRFKKLSLFFINQQGSGRGTAIEAYRTGLGILTKAVVYAGWCPQYLTILGDDTSCFEEKKGDNYKGNGLLKLLRLVEDENLFMVGGKWQPIVVDDGQRQSSIKPDPVISFLSDLHPCYPGAAWALQAGTMMSGREALAVVHTIVDGLDFFPDLATWLFATEVLGHNGEVTDEVLILDNAAEAEQSTLLHTIANLWQLLTSTTLEELTNDPELPLAWKKMTRWVQGAYLAERLFGSKITRPSMSHNVLRMLYYHVQLARQRKDLSYLEGLRYIWEMVKAAAVHLEIDIVARRVVLDGRPPKWEI